MSTLVTGGAGYIGAHVARLLARRGDDVVVVDDLSTGQAARVGAIPLLRIDLAAASAPERLARAMTEHAVTQVVHLGDPAVENLVSIAVDRLRTGRPISVYGDDYPTSDGTGVRDYVHVADLADAHLAVHDGLDRLAASDRILNVGTGAGSSVLQVLAALGAASGRPVRSVQAPRRAGDPAEVTADVARITRALGWRARHVLGAIVESAWAARPVGDVRLAV